MLRDIAHFRAHGRFPGPWVFVNAWAIYDRRTEIPPESYSDNPAHPFNLAVGDAAGAGIDVVFCAGNCGPFCPDLRCGINDRGPGRSILGANSHPRVLTVGAVRCDTTWLGYSSQGPGQPNLDVDKPDLCAPSEFREDHDAHTGNSGTSAASGLAAGVVAALRSRVDPVTWPPVHLKQLLLDTARKTETSGRDDRVGYGIIDAAAAVRALALPPP
ncbi:S8 family peptidase [Rhodovastum sp. RN2-1]|uniref:S8 family peptidase n=2 Tax=Limobrevibacterium gyesilva TaxID=2991712 RepID=A0AA41YHP3_9PROT|nr:S8 family peptidase [Limobrevibacterium gyesilva]MCW3473579.1 S8 family peptidase [Limobrevibacterium gyesilva]